MEENKLANTENINNNEEGIVTPKEYKNEYRFYLRRKKFKSNKNNKYKDDDNTIKYLSRFKNKFYTKGVNNGNQREILFCYDAPDLKNAMAFKTREAAEKFIKLYNIANNDKKYNINNDPNFYYLKYKNEKRINLKNYEIHKIKIRKYRNLMGIKNNNKSNNNNNNNNNNKYNNLSNVKHYGNNVTGYKKMEQANYYRKELEPFISDLVFIDCDDFEIEFNPTFIKITLYDSIVTKTNKKSKENLLPISIERIPIFLDKNFIMRNLKKYPQEINFSKYTLKIVGSVYVFADKNGFKNIGIKTITCKFVEK